MTALTEAEMMENSTEVSTKPTTTPILKINQENEYVSKKVIQYVYRETS
jgi:hypothetical protein